MSNLLTLKELSKHLPGKVSLSTIHRWRLRGIRGIPLPTLMIGGRRYVERDALDRWIADTTAAADGTPRPVRTPRQRERAIEAAEKELREEHGIG